MPTIVSNARNKPNQQIQQAAMTKPPQLYNQKKRLSCPVVSTDTQSKLRRGVWHVQHTIKHFIILSIIAIHLLTQQYSNTALHDMCRQLHIPKQSLLKNRFLSCQTRWQPPGNSVLVQESRQEQGVHTDRQCHRVRHATPELTVTRASTITPHKRVHVHMQCGAKD